MILAPPAWLAGDGAQRILVALDAAAGSTRLVGGCVRDAVLGLPVADVDLATQLTPAEVMARLEAAGLRAVPTGIAHGTVTAVAPGLSIEVTTLRRDVATDGRHAQVTFTDDWRADAARRDFTINALYAHAVSREIYDYFDGFDDLAARRVRFIGAPLQRIAEDHLRILRFFRFYARFGAGPPDAEGLVACAARANDLMALSRERVQGELSKLLAVADPGPAVTAMFDAGIFVPVLPEARRGGLARLVTAEVAAGLPRHWLRRLAALLPLEAALLDGVATRLRLSNAERKRLVAMAGVSSGDLQALAYRDGPAAVADRLLLRGEAAAAAAIAAWQQPALPVSGRDLVALGVPPGPEISRKLTAFEAAWVAAGFPSDSQVVAGLLSAAVSGG